MNEFNIIISEENLRLIQMCLDFYFRVGIGQFNVILEHPTFKEHLEKEFSSKEILKIGDDTPRGKITEITDNYIKTKGNWGNGEEIKEWKDVENIKHSPDYNSLREYEDKILNSLNFCRNLLYKDEDLSRNGSWGIHNEKVSDLCRQAFDLMQIIRHEFWKINPNKSNSTVDSSIYFTTTNDNHGIFKISVK